MLLKGTVSEALEALQSAIDLHGADPNLLWLLGIAFKKLKRFSDAEQQLLLTTKIIPHHARALEDLCDVLLALGRTEDAISALRRAIQHSPEQQRLNHRLGEILSLIGDASGAEVAFDNSLQHSPSRTKISEALKHAQDGNLPEAHSIYEEVLKADSENVDALRLLGVLHIRSEQYDQAIALFRQAVRLAPDFWKAWINLGTALSERQSFDDAEKAYLKALQIKPRSLHTFERLGANSMKAGRLEQSISWLEKALEISEEHFPALLCLGHALKTQGDQAGAIEAYHRCIDAKPDFGEAYWSLANLKTYRFSDAEVDQMLKHLDSLATLTDEESVDSHIAISFALGKAFEDKKNFSRAYSFYKKGNTKKRLKTTYDPIQFQDHNDRIIEVFNKKFFNSREGWGFDDDAPIFIVGLPRSGSTLLEQILASHSQVEGTAELHYLLRLATDSGANRIDRVRYPEVLLNLESHHVKGIGQEYIESTMKHRSSLPFFTDKMPNNFSAVGFLHTILPKAKVIDARRHPLDSCLGTYKQLFASGQVFSYDTYDLAHYYLQYMRLMNHWDDVLPGKVLTVHYEETVANLESQTRTVANHCGLTWEAGMMDYHSNVRAVRTASSEQVRQPIYSSSVNLWKSYEPELDELIEHLEPLLKTFPSEDRPAKLFH